MAYDTTTTTSLYKKLAEEVYNNNAFIYISCRVANMKYNYKKRCHEFKSRAKQFSYNRAQLYYDRNGALQYPAWDGSYIMVTNAGDMPRMLQALDLVPQELGEHGEQILIVPVFVIEKNKEVVKIVEQLCEAGAEMIYDERDEDAPLVSDPPRLNPNTKKLTFSGGLPRVRYVKDDISQDLLFVTLRERFLQQCNKVWDTIVLPRHKNYSVRGNITGSISRCRKFANLLMLGHGDFNTFEKRGKAAKWKAEALCNVEFPTALFSEEVQEAAKSVEEFEQVGQLWTHCCEQYWVKITLDLGDLDTEEDLDKRLAFLGHCFEVDTLLNALDRGLSAQDVLCGGPGRGW